MFTYGSLSFVSFSYNDITHVNLDLELPEKVTTLRLQANKFKSSMDLAVFSPQRFQSFKILDIK